MSVTQREFIKSACNKIDAEHSGTPIIICDNSFRIIYKNRAAFHIGMPRRGACILSHLSPRDAEKCERVSSGEEKSTAVVVKLKEKRNICGIMCAYKVHSLENIWIFPAALSSVCEKNTKEKLVNCIVRLSELIEYTKRGEEPVDERELNSYHKMLQVGFSCITGYLPLSHSPDMSVDNILSVIKKYVLTINPERINISLCDKFPSTLGLYMENPEMFISSFITMLVLLSAGHFTSLNIGCSALGGVTVFEVYINLSDITENRHKSLSEYLTEENSLYAEALIFDYICDTLGWEFSIAPCSTVKYNTIVKIKVKAKQTNRFYSGEKEETPEASSARFAAFLKNLGY